MTIINVGTVIKIISMLKIQGDTVKKWSEDSKSVHQRSESQKNRISTVEIHKDRERNELSE